MYIERPPFLYRALFPGAIWRVSKEPKCVYLTFDDGPIPEITPWVLDLLDRYNIKATFFCVGENVQKYPEIYQDILSRGHRVGNHTFNHIQGLKTSTSRYLSNVKKASAYIDSDLFRPPHGHINPFQFWLLKRKYRIIMWDLITRDYDINFYGQDVLRNVRKFARNGSIIVFHDSLKAKINVMFALPRSIEWLLNEGYTFELL